MKKKQNTEELNKELKKKIQASVDELRQKEQLLVQQAKLASMGEMIEAIAHQWRQPLVAISGTLLNIEDVYESDELDVKYLKKQLDSAEKNLTFMSKTIDDFRNFFSPSKQKQIFNVVKTIQNAISLTSAQVSNKDIQIKLNVLEDENLLTVDGYPNEFTQVLVNIFTNAKDAINEKIRKDNLGKKEGKISIEISIQDKFRAPLKTLDAHNNTDLNLGKANFRRTSKLIQGSLTKYKFKSVLPVGWSLKGSYSARYFPNLASARLGKSLTKSNPFKDHYERLGFLEVPYIIMKISDNGIGITKEKISKVFEPYFTTKEEGKGTGIGLYMSKMIIEKNMDGTIEVYRNENGATFEIKLKRASSEK